MSDKSWRVCVETVPQLMGMPEASVKTPLSTDQSSQTPPLPVAQSLRLKVCVPGLVPFILYTLTACPPKFQVSGLLGVQFSGQHWVVRN